MVLDPESQEELLTSEEVAALLHVDPMTVTRWARAGKLVAIRTPAGDRRYLRAEVLAIKSALHRDQDLDRDAAQEPSLDKTMVPSPRDGLTTDPRSGGAVEVDPGPEAAAAAVVAEAVALALEAVAADAADAVGVTAAAVTEAATQAADAAESARGARAFAADAAAQSVAAEAARAATQVRKRAEAAAAQVRQAAALAAEGLAHAVGPGTALGTGREANLLNATVQAAAEATTEETTRAAKAVRKADRAAAAEVEQTLAAAEEVVEREVTSTAQVQRELATATAADVAAETEARAAGVARVAREAAAAVVEGQWARSVDRDADLGEPELATAAREARTPDRSQELEEIFAAAEERDSRAELRDRAAAERERAASLRARHGDQQEEHEQHATGVSERRAAALDRAAAKADRVRAAMDRAKLSAQLSAGSGVWGSNGDARTIGVAAELSQHLRAPLRSIIASVEMLGVAMHESEDPLRMVDAVTDYEIITLDPDGNIETWNAGAERLKGYTPEEALGHHFSMFYTAEDRDSGLPQRLLERARADGSCEHTGWRVRKDGSQVWCDIIINAAHDDTGNLTGFVKVVRDLTEQHRLEGAQASFYNAFEHDFRMPISAIKGFAELVRDSDPEQRDDLVERLESNANRLLGMVEELIDYARLRSGLSPITLRIVDMTALAQHAVDNLASIADTSRVQVTATKPVKVIADFAALERVIANLVSNALKYSPAESEITLTCEQVKDVGVLEVVDHGRGIDERDLGSIFREFERGRLAQEDSGTGLGLASVQRLIDLQDGTVAITSQVDVGTTVAIELPLAP